MTGTLFRCGEPTGIEFRVFNGIAHRDLVAQANLAREMLVALRYAQDAMLRAGMSCDCVTAVIASAEDMRR